jgi:hypothetical protein
MKYFLFQNHVGDDNDNHIGDIIIEARNKDEAFDFLPTLEKENPQSELDDVGYTVDGDDDCLLQFWVEYPESIDDTDADDEDDFNDNYGTPYHNDFYLTGVFDTLDDADAAKASFHCDNGFIPFEESTVKEN